MNNSKLYFYGGVGSVTGANFVLEIGKSGKKIMIEIVDIKMSKTFFNLIVVNRSLSVNCL